MSQADDAVLEVRWKKVLAALEDDAESAALIEHCRKTGRLAEAARRYRELSATRSEVERALIERRLETIAAVAMTEIETAPRGEPPGVDARRILRWVAIGVFLLSLLALGYALSL